MRKLLVPLALLALALPVRAHLCNDVFAQAKDNLAVKVDIRDGQLRINKEASFRVYLLNTMDRPIANIQLAVVSPQFDAEIAPSADWKGFPHLATALKGGKKEYFNVTLKRKDGTPDGKYDIGLRLFNGQKPSMEFKTVDIADAMAIVKIPRAPAALKVDGAVAKTEWADAALCTGLQAESKKGNYTVKQDADAETRVRLSADAKSLYALITSPAPGTNDVMRLYLAPDSDAKPAIIELNLKDGTLKNAPASAVSKSSPDGIELQIPLADLNLGKTFLLNLAREKNGALAVWRGNCASVENPIVYANMIVAD
jgi:sulfur carrier protein ThiS